MSRNFIPAVLAIGMGIATGYYAFQPALRELQSEKEKGPLGQQQQQQQQQSQDQQSTPSPVPTPKEDGASK